MIKIKIEPKILKGIVAFLTGIVDEAEIKANEKGITIKAMDPSRISMLILTLPKDALDEYNCDKETKIPLSLGDFEKILNRCNSNDDLRVEFDDKDQKIKIVSKNEKNRTKTFSLKCVELDAEDFDPEKILKLDYPVSFVMDVEMLGEAIKDAEVYSEIITFTTTPELLRIESSGQVGELDYQLEKSELLNYESKENSIGSYALSFLKPILKASSIIESLEINLKTDHPLRAIITLDKGDIKYFLAPRVEESDEVNEDEDEETFEDTNDDGIGSEKDANELLDHEVDDQPKQEEETKEQDIAEEKPKKPRKKKKIEEKTEEIEELEEETDLL